RSPSRRARTESPPLRGRPARPSRPVRARAGAGRRSTLPLPGQGPAPQRPRPSVRSLELFAVPVVELLDPSDYVHSPPVDLPRPRVPADVVRLARAPRDEAHTGLACAKRMRDTRARRTRDDRALANGLGL